MALLLSLVFATYLLAVAILIVAVTQAFRNTLSVNTQEGENISVIIPVRNEAENILFLLQDLEQQSVRCEILVIDDHSEDHTAAIATAFRSSRHVIRVIPAIGTGKKRALAQGIAAASGSIVVTTDGDCRVQPEWLAVMQTCFYSSEVKMAFGGVRIAQHQSFFHDVQAIEFGSLIGTAAASAERGYPTMCNGANLAFRKAVFNEVKGYEGNIEVASGDDEFLMRKIRQIYPRGICFVANREAVVTTRPSDTLHQFIQQRLRWAGKWRHNTSLYTVLLAVYIFGIQALTWLSLIGLLWVKDTLRITMLVCLLLKMLLEYVYLKQVSRHLNIRWNTITFITLQLLYPWYVTGIGLFAHFVPQRWKGRTL
ncbi:MAG TPA: glycosyltransferase [Ohtaekwangia sp.]|uniref:glycosyltransferase n=1 Tax=Ohtaekwangia sp. TaxID=2066019 RepID=UPI002F93D230